MTEEELRKQLLLILAFKAFDDNPPTMGEVATKILTLTEQYYREAGYIPCIYEKGPCDGDAECNPFTDCWGCGRRPLGGKGEPK